jgi:hypothetical protein
MEISASSAKHNLLNLASLWANGNFGANRSDVVAAGIYQRDVNVAVCFHFCVNDAPCERVPLLLGGAFSPLCSASNPHPSLALSIRKSARA